MQSQRKPTITIANGDHLTLLSPLFRLPLWGRLLLVGGGFCLLAMSGILLTRESGRIAMIWFPNALLLGVILQAPLKDWRNYFLAAYVGNLAANLLSGDTLLIGIGLSLMNTLEILVAAAVIWRIKPALDIGKTLETFIFVGSAGILAPAISAMAASVFLHFAVGASIPDVLKIWYCADALGLLVFTPFLIAQFPANTSDEEFLSIKQPIFWGLQTFNLAVSIAIFSQQGLPLLFLAFPPLLIASFYSGILGAAISSLTVAAVAIAFSIKGTGPVNLVDGSLPERIYVLQAFIATCVLFALHSASAVTEQRRLQARLKRLSIEAERAGRAKTEFLSTMSHELRTPLTAITGALELLQYNFRDSLPPPAQQLVGIASNNSERLLKMIEDILDHERIESGKLKISMVATRLSPVIDMAIESLRSYKPEKGITLEFADDVPKAKGHIDPLRLEQVLSNLLSNAIKASSDGSKVRITSSRSGEGLLRIEVKDTGPGISEDLEPRLFKKFEQGDTGNTRKSTGSGLGLSISKALIEAMDGKIGYERRGGQTTVFFVEINEV
ncbi:ATP-binding protein [Roseibium sp.]|uniref:sensor histidine kinase n=1 Tax=Roseibium sp. TaxID=1936156 RepID=UPI003A978A56